MSHPGGLRALILAGGSGTRLWPRSTDERPKPFLALTGGESLLRETFRRATALAGADNVFVSGRAAHAPLLAAELPGMTRSHFVLEPVRRNTALAIALSALAASEGAPDTVLAVLPSDQAVRDEAAFLAALRTAAEAARTNDAFVTLGIPPTRPETGFGYMEVEGEEKKEESSLNGKRGKEPAARRVVRFVEKPSLSTAEAFVASGRFFWNAGIFAFRTSLLFEEMERVSPDILKIARLAHAARKTGDSFTEVFSLSPSLSFDVAVMEKARQVLTVPCACGWSDLGSWDAVFEFLGGAPGRNVLEGPAAAVGGLRQPRSGRRSAGARHRPVGRRGRGRAGGHSRHAPGRVRSAPQKRGGGPCAMTDRRACLRGGRAHGDNPRVSRAARRDRAHGLPRAGGSRGGRGRLPSLAGTSPDRRRAGRRQDDARYGARQGARRRRPPHTVHARHSPVGHPRPDGLQRADAGIRVPPGPCFHARARRRRDQPCDAEDAGGAPAGDERAGRFHRRASPGRCPSRSSSSRRRTRSSTSARTRSPSRSSTGS